MSLPAPFILAAMPIKETEDEFWGLKPEILWQDSERMLQFVPSSQMTRTECYNALTRFFLYLGILTALNKNQTRYFLTWGVVPVLILYTLWHYEHPEHAFGSLFRIPSWISSILPSHPLIEKFTTLADFKPPAPYPEDKGEYRMPHKGNPYANPLRTMWGTKAATLPAANYLDSPQVAAEIESLQSDWYNNDPGDLYQNQQNQRALNFTAQPGSLVPDWDGTTRDWLYKLPPDYKSKKEGGNQASILVNHDNLGPRSRDGWELLKAVGM